MPQHFRFRRLGHLHVFYKLLDLIILKFLFKFEFISLIHKVWTKKSRIFIFLLIYILLTKNVAHWIHINEFLFIIGIDLHPFHIYDFFHSFHSFQNLFKATFIFNFFYCIFVKAIVRLIFVNLFISIQSEKLFDSWKNNRKKWKF